MFGCQKTTGIKKFQSANLQDKKLIYCFFSMVYFNMVFWMLFIMKG